MSQLLRLEIGKFASEESLQTDDHILEIPLSPQDTERFWESADVDDTIVELVITAPNDGYPTAEEELRGRVAELEAELTEGRGHLERVLNGATTDQTQAASRWLVSDEVEF